MWEQLFIEHILANNLWFFHVDSTKKYKKKNVEYSNYTSATDV